MLIQILVHVNCAKRVVLLVLDHFWKIVLLVLVPSTLIMVVTHVMKNVKSVMAQATPTVQPVASPTTCPKPQTREFNNVQMIVLKAPTEIQQLVYVNFVPLDVLNV